MPHKSLTHHESQKIIFSKILFYFFQYGTGRILKIFHFWENSWFFWKLPLWRRKTGHFTTQQYITLVHHKSLMNHDSQKIIYYYNSYLFFLPNFPSPILHLYRTLSEYMDVAAGFVITTGGLETVVSVHNSTYIWCPINL